MGLPSLFSNACIVYRSRLCDHDAHLSLIFGQRTMSNHLRKNRLRIHKTSKPKAAYTVAILLSFSLVGLVFWSPRLDTHDSSYFGPSLRMKRVQILAIKSSVMPG